MSRSQVFETLLRLLSLGALVLCASPARAAFDYDLSINKTGYVLLLDFDFSAGVTLNEVKQNLKSGTLLKELGAKVDSVTTKTRDIGYEATTHVRNFFVLKTELLSLCREQDLGETWTRNCDLDVTEKDGGKYMEWKRDTITCARANGLVACKARIEGKAKPLTMLGMEILSSEEFTLKAKQEAIANFAKVWLHTELLSVSPKISLKHFENGPWPAALEKITGQNAVASRQRGQLPSPLDRALARP
ncbi:MAG TPA: hypothetical protein VFV50_07845 [Bdellovibrionales bacterium]|nr:hypothetical protein [Bdellovibrionales bacterium]